MSHCLRRGLPGILLSRMNRQFGPLPPTIAVPAVRKLDHKMAPPLKWTEHRQVQRQMWLPRVAGVQGHEFLFQSIGAPKPWKVTSLYVSFTASSCSRNAGFWGPLHSAAGFALCSLARGFPAPQC